MTNVKTDVRNLFVISFLIAGLEFISAGRLAAQTFSYLHSFSEGTGTCFHQQRRSLPAGQYGLIGRYALWDGW